MLKKYILLCLFGLVLLPVYGQQISIEFGPNQIPIETYFTISIRLKGEPLKEASPFPEIEGFQKSNRFSKKVTLKTGNNLVEEVHTQNYAALNEGTFTIKPFSITVNGQAVKSPGITVQVGPVNDDEVPGTVDEPDAEQAELPNTGGQSFLNVEVSKKQIYTGEGVHVALYFYLSSAENGQLEFYDFLQQLPEIFKKIKQPTCWEEVWEQSEVLPDTVMVKKEKYIRYKLYEAVNYPLNAQNLVFPALTLKMLKYTPAKDATFADEKRQSEVKLFYSTTKMVAVKALPPHPRRESVPVGIYRLDENLERAKVPINRAVNYNFSIIGEGNIAALPAPVLQNLPTLEIYPPQIKESILRQQQRISGSKQFNYSIIPKTPGKVPLRQLMQFIYFDPKRERYDTLQSRFTLQVIGTVDRDAAIGTGVAGDFYNLIQTEDNNLVSIHKFEKLKLYTNLIVLLLLAISIYTFFRKT
ncbi:BatD family protein [Adhaeribacter swui]|uniref:BatD family protein n=1 Tax=Adhaeribacter swui TaxID=2086471 RepID=A0A7G7GAS4_9BACT|nr:BatD family protein [Adhaeribacter swui]QNF34258.1 BatD family protein [Adhaeribacter swui]